VAGVAWPPLLTGDAASLSALMHQLEETQWLPADALARQFQFIQRDLDTIEVRLVCDAPLSADQERRIGDLVGKALDFSFKLQFAYFPEQIPRGPGGKFEEFVCALAR